VAIGPDQERGNEVVATPVDDPLTRIVYLDAR